VHFATFPIVVKYRPGLATNRTDLERRLKTLGASEAGEILVNVGLPRTMPYFFVGNLHKSRESHSLFVAQFYPETVASNRAASGNVHEMTASSICQSSSSYRQVDHFLR